MEFAENRKGVMIFAATVEHAREVTGLLPVGQVALITGETPGRSGIASSRPLKRRRIAIW